MKPQFVKVRVAAASYPYTHSGVQDLIRSILDLYGLTPFELAKRSGVNPATLYQILKKSEREVSRPPRKSTIQALARAIGAEISFDSVRNLLTLRSGPLPEAKHDDVTEFLLQVADAVKQSGRTAIPRDERDRILRVIRVLL